jgi:rhodanese-related sulfurtransferase
VVVINRTELLELIDRGCAPVLVETLPRSVYEQAHLPGAVNMPPEVAPDVAAILLPDTATLVVVYGAGPECPEPARVASQLEKMGYANVCHYVGGKRDWFTAGLRMQVIGSSQIGKAAE